MIKVLIVEDEPIAAEAFASYVQRVAGFVVGGVARTGADALTRLSTSQFCLVLLDMLPRSGPRASRRAAIWNI